MSKVDDQIASINESQVGTKAVLLHPFKPLVCIADDQEIIRYHLSLVGCDEYLGCTENIDLGENSGSSSFDEFKHDSFLGNPAEC